MDVLDLARLQFASTTLFTSSSFLSIGLAVWVAICQSAAYRTGDDAWERAARFWGRATCRGWPPREASSPSSTNAPASTPLTPS